MKAERRAAGRRRCSPSASLLAIQGDERRLARLRPPSHSGGPCRIGSVVNGKYRIDSILGRGAMGIVAECQHIELCERVALKFLLTTRNVTHDDLGVRFLREAQVSAKLRNEHIARAWSMSACGSSRFRSW